MSRDIASSVINEMGMTPQMVDDLHRSQMQSGPGYPGMPGMPGMPGYAGMPGGAGMPGYGGQQPGGMQGYDGQPGMPAEYSQTMIPSQMQQPRPMMGSPDVSTESSSSNDGDELKKLGLGQSSFMSYVKGPLIVMFIVFMLCLTQTDVLIRGLLPVLVGLKLVAAKAALGGLIYLASLLVIGH
jgi:hypothetical protein